MPEFEDALILCERAGDIFRQYLIYGWRGQGYLLTGRHAEAEADLKRCLELGDQIGTSFHRGAFQAFQAKLRLLEGDVGEALRHSAEALEVATDTAQAWSRSIALRIHAEALVALQPARVEQAEDDIRSAIEIQERRECRFDLAWSHLAKGRVMLAKGDLERRRRQLPPGRHDVRRDGPARRPRARARRARPPRGEAVPARRMSGRMPGD